MRHDAGCETPAAEPVVHLNLYICVCSENTDSSPGSINVCHADACAIGRWMHRSIIVTLSQHSRAAPRISAHGSSQAQSRSCPLNPSRPQRAPGPVAAPALAALLHLRASQSAQQPHRAAWLLRLRRTGPLHLLRTQNQWQPQQDFLLMMKLQGARLRLLRFQSQL